MARHTQIPVAPLLLGLATFLFAAVWSGDRQDLAAAAGPHCRPTAMLPETSGEGRGEAVPAEADSVEPERSPPSASQLLQSGGLAVAAAAENELPGDALSPRWFALVRRLVMPSAEGEELQSFRSSAW